MTAIVLVLLVLMLLVGVTVALGIHHRRSRSGGILGVQRSAGSSRRSG